jgi:4-diphosphocytidyl-2-C-methyl-D-erythritol kinase
MRLERPSPCKVNLVLNILGRRPDGFHELETIMQPVNVRDMLAFETKQSPGIELTCSEPSLPTDSGNLVHRAAVRFLEMAGVADGVRIHLEKRIPLAAGLGGGSGNAANTLLGLNEIFGSPLDLSRLHDIAASLGSDIPFFLQSQPALAVGRGEQIIPLPPFAALAGTAILLVHPGFGIATAWAYQNLARFPAALNGERGRAERVVSLLNGTNAREAGCGFYNSLEAPALDKYPVLALYQDYFRERGACATLMSGSGSTTFAIFRDCAAAEAVVPEFKAKFGNAGWTAIVPLS